MIGATSLLRSTNGFATKPNNAKLDWIGGYHPTYFSIQIFIPIFTHLHLIQIIQMQCGGVMMVD